MKVMVTEHGKTTVKYIDVDWDDSNDAHLQPYGKGWYWWAKEWLSVLPLAIVIVTVISIAAFVAAGAMS